MYKCKPSKSKAREFAQKMDEIDEFCRANGISQSARSDSYYFMIGDISYRVSNHSVEASNAGAYDWKGEKIRELYHEDGRREDTVYINAGKTRIIEIYNDLKNGYKLDGNGRRRI